MRRVSLVLAALVVAGIALGAILQFQRGLPVAAFTMLVGAVFVGINVRARAQSSLGAFRTAVILCFALLAGCVMNFASGPADLIYFSSLIFALQAASLLAEWRDQKSATAKS
ncbi:MAG: hypothetical protein IPK60_02365 [Sandaracinaceae bacterium]|nr:hypothetical protein [Sandaracinaceae bacterium]